jgi:hypothetical protein
MLTARFRPLKKLRHNHTVTTRPSDSHGPFVTRVDIYSVSQKLAVVLISTLTF